ncbi:hypothetical protein GCM10010277_80570 [Streptomyces longisporoflavus]|uniref:hypothetical protein n=1 Tax=Streptomyces longisporoflavus TaxID=28044 RepID=UPI00167CA3B7|nr:hypothetical protein [Streptomyces longisporoflavus]GGV69985.1 hypothetical protein GCM10010277_80570 [Streptomyces longisporoflavus]
MTVFHCVNCQQPLTGEVEPGEPLRGPERPPGHEIASPRMAQGTFKVNFDGSLLILHPDDVLGTAPHGDARRLSGCCGLAGHEGPNLVCSGCGTEVAMKEDDCWTDNLVALAAAAVSEGRQP